MPPREIRELPSGLSLPLLKAGSRTPVFVANENESEALHRRYVHRLSEIEFFAPEEPDTIKTLRAKAEKVFCKQERFGLTLMEFDSDVYADGEQEVFNLPPLSERRITAHVQSIGPAPFVFVDEEDAPCEDL